MRQFFFFLDVYALVSAASGETKLGEEAVELDVPCSRGLF